MERNQLLVSLTDNFHRGLRLLDLQLVENHQVIDRIRSISGIASAQHFRTITTSRGRSMEPLPEGYYKLGPVEWAGGRGNYGIHWPHSSDGLGPVWIGMECTSPSERQAIGIHLDANADWSSGTAGCVGIPTLAELKQLVSWFDDPRYCPKMCVVDWGLGTVTAPVK